MELERANKEWLTFIQKWLNTLKKKHVISLDVLQQFDEKSPLLETHLKAISSWLKNNGIKEATKCLPTVGKLLAGLSKICLVLAKDDLSSSLLDCFFHLSGLWHENEAGNKHPKIWAMEHFSSMTTVDDLSGLEQCLFDEFGITHEEYMKEHISFITDGMNEAIQDKVNPNTLTSVEIGSIIKSLLQNHQHRQLIELIDQIIINPSCHSNDDLFSCVLDNTDVRNKLSVNTLCVLFTNKFRMFEQYLLGFIKNMFQKYPLLCRDDVRKICEQKRLFELLKHDDRLVIGFKEILKSCFYTMGSNPVLSLFMWTVIGELNLGTSEDKESFEDALLSIQETDNERVRFEAWFQINLNFDKIEELLLTIFQVDNKQLEHNMRYLITYFMHEMPPQSILDELLQKIKTMKRILPMKVVQITDVQSLLSSHQYAACAAILNIANVLFMGYCHGVKSFMKELVTKIVTEICKEDFEKFWFLFAVDLLAKIKTTHSELSLTVCKNQVEKYWKDMSNFKRVEMDLT